MPTVLVTDAGRGSAIAIMRSLGRQGWRVIAGDSSRWSVGFCSRRVAERVVYPAPEREPKAFARTVIDLVTRRRVDLVIPVTDAAILPLSESQDRLPAPCRLAAPEPGAFKITADKRRTLELADQLDIPTPRSRFVESAAEASQAARELGWPLVMKPVSSRVYRDSRSIESFEVTYATRPEDLERRWSTFDGRVGVLMQEYCAGAGVGIGLLMHEGRPLAAFQHRRLHEVPLTGGASSLRESVELDPLLYQHSVKMLAALKWTGLAMVEFKVGPSGPRLMEINGRIWGSLPLAVMSGVDFPRLLGELYVHGPPPASAPPQLRYRTPVRARNLGLDVIWILSALRGQRRSALLPTPDRAQGWSGLLGLLDPRCHLDLLTLDDPAPALAEVPIIIGRLGKKLRRRATAG